MKKKFEFRRYRLVFIGATLLLSSIFLYSTVLVQDHESSENDELSSKKEDVFELENAET